MTTTREQNRLQVGIFDRFDRADAAVQQLVDSGVDRERISVVCSSELPELSVGDQGIERVEGSAPERRLPAIVTGGAVGTLLGGLTAAATLAGTGGVALMFAGPLLGGTSAGIAGGLVGAMASRGLEADVADFYDQAVQDGSILVAVDAPAADSDGQPSQEHAAGVLRLHGGRFRSLPRT